MNDRWVVDWAGHTCLQWIWSKIVRLRILDALCCCIHDLVDINSNILRSTTESRRIELRGSTLNRFHNFQSRGTCLAYRQDQHYARWGLGRWTVPAPVNDDLKYHILQSLAYSRQWNMLIRILSRVFCVDHRDLMAASQIVASKESLDLVVGK